MLGVVTSAKPSAARPVPRRGARPAKRCAITAAARAVFARDGFARASVDAIAAQAGVSTRTIYNHFAGKEDLFSAVLLESATQVADGFCADVARDATGGDVRTDLIALGRAFAAQGARFPEHFALVGQIRAEAAHFPPELIAAWHQAGPLRIQRQIAERLEDLADRGLLRIDDPRLATLHLIALVTAGTTVRPPGTPTSDARDADRVLVAGIDAFLNDYGAGRGAPGRS